MAAAALFATLAPATLGIILAKVIETGGYEIKLKGGESQQKISDSPLQSPPKVKEIILPLEPKKP